MRHVTEHDTNSRAASARVISSTDIVFCKASSRIAADYIPFTNSAYIKSWSDIACYRAGSRALEDLQRSAVCRHKDHLFVAALSERQIITDNLYRNVDIADGLCDLLLRLLNILLISLYKRILHLVENDRRV